jgi:hypothetical protein
LWPTKLGTTIKYAAILLYTDVTNRYASMLKRLLFRIRRYRFTHNGYSEVTGELGKYYAKRGSNVILFVPENEKQLAAMSGRDWNRVLDGLRQQVEELVDELEY